MSEKPKPSARKKARRFALQALYQWRMAGADTGDILRQFQESNDLKKTDVDYFKELVRKSISLHEELDAEFAAFLDRDFDDLDPIEISILRLGTYEMKYRIDVPYKVVINEGIELAKTYGATDSFRYINGILDQLALKLRKAETAAEKKQTS